MLAAALVVAFVLIVAWLTGLIPALDNAIGLAPVVIIAMDDPLWTGERFIGDGGPWGALSNGESGGEG